MKNIFLALAIIFAPFISAAQNSGLNIIPKPQKVEMGEGKFVIDNNTAIFYDNSFNGNYLKDFLEKATGFSLVCIDGQKIKTGEKDSNYILFDTNCGYDIPEEGYELSVSPEKIVIHILLCSIYYVIPEIGGTNFIKTRFLENKYQKHPYSV